MIKKVIHVIPSSTGGGAEKLVLRLLAENHKDCLRSGVFFSKPDGSYHSDRAFFNNKPRSLLNIIKLRKYLKAVLKHYGESEIIVHCHLTWPLYYVPIASIGMSLNLVYTEHSTFNKRRNYPLLRSVDRLAYSRFSKIICISEAVSSSLVGWLGQSYQNKIVTINNGSDLYDFFPRKNIENNSKLKLLSVGSLKYLKGFETIIKCLGGVKDTVESYTIVGIGSDLERLKKLVVKYGVEDIVYFAGWSDSPEDFYRNADVLLIPSHWEGFGLVAVEGMSTGLPVIASNVGGLNEVVSKSLGSAILVDEYLVPNKWASAILKMRYLLSIKASEMAIESRRQSENFDIKQMLVAYDGLYKNIGES